MITAIFISILILIISAIPLNIALKIFGAKTSLLKTALVVFISGLVIIMLQSFFSFGGFLAFILLIFIYKYYFRIGWWKTLFAWLLQFVIVVILILLALIFGITLILI